MALYEKECKLCKTEFSTDRYNSIYCGSKCRNKAWRISNRPIKKLITINCLMCKKPVQTTNKLAKYCFNHDEKDTSTCRTNAYNIRKRNKMRNNSNSCPVCNKKNTFILMEQTGRICCTLNRGCGCYFTEKDYPEIVSFHKELVRLEKITARFGDMKV